MKDNKTKVNNYKTTPTPLTLQILASEPVFRHTMQGLHASHCHPCFCSLTEAEGSSRRHLGCTEVPQKVQWIKPPLTLFSVPRHSQQIGMVVFCGKTTWLLERSNGQEQVGAKVKHRTGLEDEETKDV